MFQVTNTELLRIEPSSIEGHSRGQNGVFSDIKHGRSINL
jgi:hypothetical protein